MIKLVNVSKFYYSKGVVASGFSKINLEFNMGEFVAITGESGSGKSTLLNVISGLDSYEEGEMYINGEETSHYTENDFENYRRNYIGNIFQNFNLVNSYTVYQNIELVLILNGENKKDIKQRVIDLINKVDLYKFRNTKVSKLSGGQKQRVAIARALAKDTPIIIADEPTGNLDSKSATEVIKLLSEISKNKLVIIVTHNYEQVENYVTRKIKMHDGKVLEDKIIKSFKENIKINPSKYKNITFFSKLRLGVRNTFNIIPKFLLVFLVYLFITIALLSEYSSFKQEEYITDKSGYNSFFSNTNDTRIIIKKEDRTFFNEEEYQKILKLENVDYIVKNDLLLDSYIDLTDESDFWLSGNINAINLLKGNVSYGRMPEATNEIIIEGNKDDYYLGLLKDELINKTLYLQDSYTGNVDKSISLKVVGIKYYEDNYNYKNEIYASDEVIDKLSFQINQRYSNLKVLFLDTYHESNTWDNNYKLIPNKNVQSGYAYITSDLNYLCKYETCRNYPISIEINNIYYNDTLNLKVSKTYSKNSIKSLLGISDFDSNNGGIFISISDYNNLFNRETYQSSVFVNDVQNIDSTIKELNDMGITTLKIKDTLVNYDNVQFIKILKTIVTIILVVALFFISYFVIRIILKSRNIYFSTIRMLGATKNISRKLLIIELLTVSNLAYFLFLTFIYLNKIEVFNIGFVQDMILFLNLKDYILLYIILMIISFLVSQKFASSLFKSSAINTIKEEV